MFYRLSLLFSALLSISVFAAPELFLPKTVYASPGIESNIYFENVFHTTAPLSFAYEVECSYGKQESKRWTWIPSDADAGKDFELTLRVFDDNGLKTSGKCRILVAPASAKPTGKITFAFLGDSVVNCMFLEKLFDKMRQNGFSGYTPVGDFAAFGKKPKPGDIPHDGLGGFTWSAFLSRWTYSKREISMTQNQAEIEQMKYFGISSAKYGEHLLKSPLLKLENGKKVIDIPGWFERINQGNAPDIIVISLGGNDIFECDEKNLDDRLKKSILPSAAKLLDELRKHAPNARICVTASHYGGSQDGFGANYNCQKSRYQFRRNKLRYNQEITKLVENRNDLNLSVLPFFHGLDPEGAFILREKKVNNCSTRKEIRCENALHLSSEGAMQLADIFYCRLTNLIARDLMRISE